MFSFRKITVTIRTQEDYSKKVSRIYIINNYLFKPVYTLLVNTSLLYKNQDI